MYKEFKTHLGEIVSGERLQEAVNVVADWQADNARGIREEDLYAAHVTEAQKDANLEEGLARAERIRNGEEPMGFWLWQRINTQLTGECVPMLPKRKET